MRSNLCVSMDVLSNESRRVLAHFRRANLYFRKTLGSIGAKVKLRPGT